jgi:hypothetical protein
MASCFLGADTWEQGREYISVDQAGRSGPAGNDTPLSRSAPSCRVPYEVGSGWVSEEVDKERDHKFGMASPARQCGMVMKLATSTGARDSR